MDDPTINEDTVPSAKPSKFRFKSTSKSKASKRSRSGEDKGRGGTTKHHRRRRSRSPRDTDHSHHSKRERHDRAPRSVYDHTFARNGEYDKPENRNRESLYDGLNEEEYRFYADDGVDEVDEVDKVDSEAAFRESLFDALADDEGALYWEGVYGQPVHIYPNTKRGSDGKLERMTDDEYVEYVRSKMWEKSHQHIIEERAAQERERAKRKEKNRSLEEEMANAEAEREQLRQRMTDSLARGKERQRARDAEAAWNVYVQKWADLRNHKDIAQESAKRVQELIPWPVASGKRQHVSKEEIEFFFEKSSAWREDPNAMLKVERVRWHPDKMQQRFGQHIDVATMKCVTAVFQVIDKLWTERRK